MHSIKEITYNELDNFIGKKVHFISDCEFFPNFDVRVTIISYSISNNNEIIFNTITDKNRKQMKIGSKMKNLQFSFL